MTRRIAALLPALALALCYARAGAWAGPSKAGGEHACCGRGAPAKTGAMSDCCVSAAAAGSVHLVRVDAPAIAASLPAAFPDAPLFAVLVPALPASSPGFADRASSPARAPPLA